MKVFVALLALLAVAAATNLEGSPLQLSQWKNFKATHGKSYSRALESARFQAFLESSAIVEAHNERFAKGLESFEMELNKFADMPHSEFKKLLGYRKDESGNKNATMFVPTGLGAPTAVDWRSSGLVSRVRNQGGCGSCYTFACAAAMEGAFARKYGRMVEISEQHLLDCTGSWGNYGCDGGFMTTTFRFAQQQGVARLDQYPYQGRVMSCRSNGLFDRLSGQGAVQRNENALKEAVAAVGPLTVAVNAEGSNSWQYYRGGILDDPYCDPRGINHAVTLVGYGSDGGRDYWIIKNSWGQEWGERGYVRLARGKNMCGVASDISYPIA